MIRMKAKRTFRGQGSEGRPKKGQEFHTDTDRRADDLVGAGLADRIDQKSESAPANKMEPPLENKSAITQAPRNENRPLPLTGGATGQESAPSSSAPERVQAPSMPPRRGAKQGS